MSGRNWVVEVAIQDENEEIYGPYTQLQAERVAARLMKEAEEGRDQIGMTHHPLYVAGAFAWPLTRYDKFLTTEEKREMRRETRAADREEPS